MTGNPELLHARPKLARRARLQTDPVTGADVLLYPEGILELNETAHEIVSRCDGVATVADLIAAMEAEYDAAPGEMQADVLAW